VYDIVENPVISQIQFTGNTVFSSDDLLKFITVRKGDVLNTLQLRSDIENVIKHYNGEGVSVGSYDLSIDRANVLTIRLVERKIAKIVVIGNTRTKTSIITPHTIA
jgi:outer membrane protein insertion porin family